MEILLNPKKASQSPKSITITGRSQNKIQESLQALREEFPAIHFSGVAMDLASQKSVRTAASEVLETADSIDILINNAGVMLIPERQLSDDGIEMHFATNHIGHFLFTNLILPKLSNPARVVNLSSSSPTQAGVRFSDPNFSSPNKTLPEDERPDYNALKQWGASDPGEMSYFPREAYNQSKVANLLFSIGLNEHFHASHGILSFAVNPGVIMTDLQRHFTPEGLESIQKFVKSGAVTMKKPGAGAATTLIAAADPALGLPEASHGKENYGVYLTDCQISTGALAKAESSANAERLWKLSEDLVRQKSA